MAHWYRTYLASEIDPSESVLSLGCGVLADIEGVDCKELVGIDIYFPYIKELRKRFAGDTTRRFVHGNLLEVEWPYQGFDVVIATDILEHLPLEPAIAMLAKMKRWARRMVIVYTPRVFFDNVTESPDGRCDVLSKINREGPYKGLGRNKYQRHQCVIPIAEFDTKGYRIVDNPDTGLLAVWFNFEALPNPVGSLRHENRFWENVGKSANPFEAVRGGWGREDFEKREDETILNLFDVQLSKGDLFVDLGCGLGYICKMVAPKVRGYVGIDYSASILNKAREINARFPNATFIHNDGRTIPLPSESVDILISEQVFQHMGLDVGQAYFKEIARVMKPDGRFCLQLPKRSAYKVGFDKGQLIPYFSDDEIFSIDEWYWHVVRNVKRTEATTWIGPR
uniref:Putative methyltransferase n=2 Tax=viral metagenome TaxID=1070528 RepID=A0A6M3KM61_9ZZZZ